MNAVRQIEAGGTIAYKVAYARLPGADPIVAIFLSQAAYWSARAFDGWCWITHEKMESQTGLSQKQQDRAAKILAEIGVLQKVLKGLPAKIHYAVDFEKLETLLSRNSKPVVAETATLLYEEKITEETTGFVSTEITKKHSAKRKETPSSPTIEEWQAHRAEVTPWWPESQAERAYGHYESTGWTRKGLPIQNWRGCFRTCSSSYKADHPQAYAEAMKAQASAKLAPANSPYQLRAGQIESGPW